MVSRLWILCLVSVSPLAVRAEDHWAFQPIRRPAAPQLSDSWIRNPIDRFVLAKLKTKHLRPSPRAPRTTLIRRLYLDLTGLPPSWNQVKEFLADKRPDAYQQTVDRLLASPRYGERWGRHWLDVARYSDSSGYESDRPREIWRFRDWVIQAINKGMPFDQFVTEQLAGDLLPNTTQEQKIATGFHCNAMLDPGVRWESIVDRVEATGSAFLGLTLGCARCHTHKTDPVSHREFYQFLAFFNETTIVKLPLPVKKADGKPWTTLVLKQSKRVTHLLIRGEPTQPGAVVRPGVPKFLPKLSTKGRRPNRLDLARWLFHPRHPLTARVTVNRTWQRLFGLGLVATESDFGVQTPPATHPGLLDFLARELITSGWNTKQLQRLILNSATYQQSSRMSDSLRKVDHRNHWLARQVRLRLEAELIRDIPLAIAGMMDHRVGGPSVFPDQPPNILKNRATPAKWIVSKGGDRYRRGMYTWIWRLTPHPHMPLFDAPDGVASCTKRHRTNNPVQALTTLNDPVFLAAARSLTESMLRPGNDENAMTQRLFRVCLSRNPDVNELRIVARFVGVQRKELSRDPTAVRKILALSATAPLQPRHTEKAVWVVLCRVILNMDELITRE